MWTLQKVADFEYLSVFQSFHSIPFILLIFRMEESKTWEAGPNLSSSSTDSPRNFRDAVMGSKKPDRAKGGVDSVHTHTGPKGNPGGESRFPPPVTQTEWLFEPRSYLKTKQKN